MTETFIAPYLPPDAIQTIKDWEASRRIAVQRVLPRKVNAECGNCQDMGFVYASFLGFGPSAVPTANRKPSTWVPADERTRPGWYVIENTIAYPCPHCSNKVPIKKASVHREVQTQLKALTEDLATPRKDLA